MLENKKYFFSEMVSNNILDMNESEQNEIGRDDDGTDQSDSSSSATTDMDSDVELDRGGLEEIIRLVRGDMSGEIPTRTRRIAQETLLNILRQRSISGLVSDTEHYQR